MNSGKCICAALVVLLAGCAPLLRYHNRTLDARLNLWGAPSTPAFAAELHSKHNELLIKRWEPSDAMSKVSIYLPEETYMSILGKFKEAYALRDHAQINIGIMDGTRFRLQIREADHFVETPARQLLMGSGDDGAVGDLVRDINKVLLDHRVKEALFLY